MATAAKNAQGVVLKRGGSAIPEITDISGPDESSDRVEVTSLDSTSKEFISGLRDGGEVKCEANDIPNSSSQQGLYSDFQAGTTSTFVIDCGSSETYTFSAFVTSFSRKFSPNAARKINFTLKISGDVTPVYPA